jgi:5-hydroxyisourate hydrolase-like protein (transthyretin family)
MAKMATIAGRVIDQDGKPAAGIRVRCEITYADGTTDDPLVAVPTNPDGHFQMSVPANHKLSFDAYTFDELNGGHIDLALEANGVANDFLLEAGQEISGVELVLKKK